MAKIIALNWKLNPATEKEARRLALLSDKKGVVLFAPSIFLGSIAEKTTKAALGAQNIFWEQRGAFTGEISASMVKSVGAEWILVGHSERRKYFGETDEVVAKKLEAAARAGLKIILCVGEPWSIRKKGVEEAKKFVARQLKSVPRNVSLIVAYEPVWAIGTGKSDVPEESAAMTKFIKGITGARVLYGGSVQGENILRFLDRQEIDGVLIGGASVNKTELKKIFNQVQRSHLTSQNRNRELRRFQA